MRTRQAIGRGAIEMDPVMRPFHDLPANGRLVGYAIPAGDWGVPAILDRRSDKPGGPHPAGHGPTVTTTRHTKRLTPA